MQICICLAYDGTNYHGFQKQKNVLTIQNILEKKLSDLYQETITITSSGRTDKGVHAEGQVIAFKIKKLSLIPIKKLPSILNKKLPSDIQLLSAKEASPSFHPRYQARVRCYRYRFLKSSSKLNRIPLELLRFAYDANYLISKKEFYSYLQPFIGKHDFTSFSSKQDSAKNKIREIYHIDFIENIYSIDIDIYANAFLRNMVRSIIGNAFYFYKKKIKKEVIKSILLKKNPELAKLRIPAKGLCLKKVFYTPIFPTSFLKS